MRKVFFTLTLFSLLFAMLGSFDPNSKAMSVPLNQDSGAAPPGSRCTRLNYPPLEKRRKRSTPVAESYLDGFAKRCQRLFTGPRKGKVLPNTPPKVGLSTSTTYLGQEAGAEVRLRTIVCDPDGDDALYTYTSTAGRIEGDGPEVVWNLGGAGRPGKYTVTVEVNDGCGCVSFTGADVTVGS